MTSICVLSTLAVSKVQGLLLNPAVVDDSAWLRTKDHLEMAIPAGLVILLLSLCALSVDGIRSVPAVTGDAPDFCHDADCPKFSTKEEHDEYEIRAYEQGE